MNKLIVYVDMDDTIADFIGSEKLNTVGLKPEWMLYPKEMLQPGFFRNLKPIAGALEALRKIQACENIEVYILTKPVHHAPHTYSEKVEWIQEHLPELSERIIMTQKKELCFGDFLIDDTIDWKSPWEARSGGTFLHFDPRADRLKQWEQITQVVTAKSLAKVG